MKKKQEIKPADWKFFAVLVATGLALGGAIFYIFLTQPGTRATTQHVRPPYFLSAEAAKPFPQTLDPSQFSSKDIAAGSGHCSLLDDLPQSMELTATFA